MPHSILGTCIAGISTRVSTCCCRLPIQFLVLRRFLLRQQPKIGPVWSVAVMESTILTSFPILWACWDDTVGLTFHDDSLCRKVQRVLVHLAQGFTKASMRSGYRGSERPSFDPVCLMVATAGSVEMDWTCPHFAGYLISLHLGNWQGIPLGWRSYKATT